MNRTPRMGYALRKQQGLMQWDVKLASLNGC
jgi:hypothetical protein